ncbi:PAS domain-containing protein [Streptomyces sp. GC420]|uniref:PAS domain-containing protein n=1 Tax=Streptomyces sp. GC420 TaxID=2697568 RepID=UPI001414E9ED|nr:PAS domain-containing protein [Streptomyces sp. GC420]NBM18858.1 PAS domain-containing protein [Streptomyces sp. GC420]
MTQRDEFREELADFSRRVAELKTARSLPAEERLAVLDAALFELEHVAETLLPEFRRVAASLSDGSGHGNEEQQLLRAVFQRLPLPVVLMDRETVVRRLNFAATTVVGARAGYATGRPLSGLLAHADRAAFRSQAAAVARGEGDRSLVVRVQHSEAALRATMTALRPPAEPRTAVLLVLQPGAARTGSAAASVERATAPDLAEATGHAAQMDLLDAVATALLGAPAGDRDEVLRRTAAVLHERFADWVVVDSGAERLVRETVLGPRGALREEIAAQDPGQCPLAVEAARSGKSGLQVRPEDPDGFGRDSSGASVLVRAGVTSLVCVPLTLPNGAVQGVVTLFRTGARLAFSLAEARTVDVLSRHVALAMRRRRRA